MAQTFFRTDCGLERKTKEIVFLSLCSRDAPAAKKTVRITLPDGAVVTPDGRPIIDDVADLIIDDVVDPIIDDDDDFDPERSPIIDDVTDPINDDDDFEAEGSPIIDDVTDPEPSPIIDDVADPEASPIVDDAADPIINDDDAEIPIFPAAPKQRISKRIAAALNGIRKMKDMIIEKGNKKISIKMACFKRNSYDLNMQ